MNKVYINRYESEEDYLYVNKMLKLIIGLDKHSVYNPTSKQLVDMFVQSIEQKYKEKLREQL